MRRRVISDQGLIMSKLRQGWPSWGNDPHNPWSGKDRPAFNWNVYYAYCEGKVDKDGNPKVDR